MKETKIFMFDDLDYADGERRVEADRTVTLALGDGDDDERAELDLTDAHAKELRDLLAPYFAAYAAARERAKPPARPAPPSKGRNPTDYNAGMRRYADARGISYRTAGGGHVYYSASLRADYEQYLADGGRPL